VRRLRDPIHGTLRLSPIEAELLDTRPMQRLRRIRQLGLTNLVYPGAEHSRFTHSLGACHVAGQLGEALVGGGWRGDVQLLRVAALLHDVGHPPFSHAGEQGVAHEHMSAAIIRHGDVAEVLLRHGFDPEQVLAQFDPRREPVTAALVSGQLDADRMDYLLRDAFHCGVSYGRYDLPRLVETIGLSADGRVGVRQAGLYAVEGFLLARYAMFLQVYFHRTRRILDLLLEEVLPRWPTDVEGYLAWDDARVLEVLRDDARPAARCVRDRCDVPACIAEFETTADPADREAADSVAARVREAIGHGVHVDSSARLVAFRPGGDIPILDADGAATSVFTASPVLRRMDPDIELRRVYAPRARAEEARAIVRACRGRGLQLRLFTPDAG
jgi:HD superfamily phosphohydrolase